MISLREEVAALFAECFNSSPEFFFHAPGRVNLIGEHTDYNEGFVLPCAIDRGTFMAVSLRDDNIVHVVAGDIGKQASEWASSLPISHDTAHSWANYLRGVNEQYLTRGANVQGMNIAVLGNIPQGAGLSSSASFSVAFATTINAVNKLNLSPTEVALICQAAENDFVGCKCGIMDQLISAAGQDQSALLIDCRSLDCETITMPEDMQVVIIDSKVTRGLVDSEYNDRRVQCEAAAKHMGAKSLREVSLDDLLAHKSNLDPTIFKRAHHVITENARTVDSAQAIKNSDYQALSGLMAKSHVSMRDDFEITTPEIDYLVEIIGEMLGENGGVRMTGGGFGGCVVALTSKQYSEKVRAVVDAHYKQKTGLSAEVHLCKASNGAGAL